MSILLPFSCMCSFSNIVFVIFFIVSQNVQYIFMSCSTFFSLYPQSAFSEFTVTWRNLNRKLNSVPQMLFIYLILKLNKTAVQVHKYVLLVFNKHFFIKTAMESCCKCKCCTYFICIGNCTTLITICD